MGYRSWNGTLLLRDPQGRDSTIVLGEQPLDIGRSLECAIRADDPMLSRKHARIEPRGERYWIVATSSAVTRVNDAPTAEHALSHNDVIQCGATVLRYVEVSAAALAVPTGLELSQGDRRIAPTGNLAGSIVTMPSGPDASPPGWKPRG